jgi:hypothetical protein
MKKISLQPRWAGLLPWMINVMRSPKTDPFVIASYALEISKLGDEAEQLMLAAIDRKKKPDARIKAEQALIKIGKEMDRACDDTDRRLKRA